MSSVESRGQGLSVVRATLIPTKRNQPARQFLEKVGAGFLDETRRGLCFSIPAEIAAALTYQPDDVRPETEAAGDAAHRARAEAAGDVKPRPQRSPHSGAVALTPERLLEALHARSLRRQRRAASGQPYIPPTNEIEAALAELWASLLRIEPVGIRDGFFELGGTSLLAVDLFAQLERRFGKRLPLTTLIEGPTIEKLALLVQGVRNAIRSF